MTNAKTNTHLKVFSLSYKEFISRNVHIGKVLSRGALGRSYGSMFKHAPAHNDDV
jgi:hypothetical protein